MPKQSEIVWMSGLTLKMPSGFFVRKEGFTMILGILNMCMCVFELISFLLVIRQLTGKGGKRILIGNILLLMLELVMLYIDNRFIFSGIGLFLPHIVMVAGVYLIYRDPFLSSVLYCIIAFVMLTALEMIFYLPLGTLGLGDLVKSVIAPFLCTIGVFVAVILCHRYQWIHFEWIRKCICLKRNFLCYICVLFAFIFLTAKYQFDLIKKMSLYTFLALMFVIVLLFPLIFSYVRNETELRVRSKYQQPMIDILTRIRQQQHQYDHQLNAIYGMLNHYKTYDELTTHLKEYMAAIEGADPCYSLFTQLEDPLLVGFLGVKFSHAASMGIEVEHEIVVKTIHSNVSLPELVGILGNVFDNAIEEVVDHALPGKIKIWIWEESGWYRIRLGNPCRAEVTDLINRFFEKGFSTKDDAGQRGFGLCSVADTVNKYKGRVIAKTKIEEDRKWFYIDIRIRSTAPI